MSVRIKVEPSPRNLIGEVMSAIVFDEIQKYLARPEVQARMNNKFMRRTREKRRTKSHE